MQETSATQDMTVEQAIGFLEQLPDPVLILRAYFLGRVRVLDPLVVKAYNRVRALSKQGNAQFKTLEAISETQSKEQREENERLKLALYKVIPKSENLKNTRAGKDYISVYGEYGISKYMLTICAQRLQPSTPTPTADAQPHIEEGEGGDSTREETTTTEEEQCPTTNESPAAIEEKQPNRKQRRAYQKRVALQQE